MLDKLRPFIGSAFIVLGILILVTIVIDRHKLWTGVEIKTVQAPPPPNSYTNTGPVQIETRYRNAECKAEHSIDCPSDGQYQFRNLDGKMFIMQFCPLQNRAGNIYPDMSANSVVDITYEIAHEDCYKFDYAKIISEPK